MRKSMIFLGCLSLFLLTGCGNKSLVCTQKADGFSSEMTISHKENKIERIGIKMDFDITGMTQEELSLTGMDKICEDSEELVGYSIENCKQTNETNKIIVKGNMPKSIFENESIGIDELKSNLESSGYTCKK